MRNVAIEFERISVVCGCWFDAVVDDAFAEAAAEDGDVEGSLTFELVGPLLVVAVVFIVGTGLSRPTSNTSIFAEEHFVADESESLSPLTVVRFCGDSDCGAIETDELNEGGGREVRGEFVADTLEDVVDVDDIEFATEICGFIAAIVCGDMRDKCGDRCVSCKCW